MTQCRRIIEHIEQSEDREPEISEIADLMGVSAEEVLNIKNYMQGVASLDCPLSDCDDLTLSDTLQADFSVENDTIDKIYTEYSKGELWGIVERYTAISENYIIKPKRHALTIEEQETFIGYMAQSPIYYHWLPVFTVLLGTGCRIGELIGLRWCDCDFENNVISINHNLIYRQQDNGKMEMHITTPKTKAGVRTIPMLSEVRKALFTERKKQMQSGFRKIEIDGYSDFVFLNREGYVHNPMTLNRAIARIVRDYNAEETENAKIEKREPMLIRHFSVHNLRHTFCTRFCENEQNLKIIQEIMGHSDISTTMNVYAEATENKKQESFKNLEGKIKIG